MPAPVPEPIFADLPPLTIGWALVRLQHARDCVGADYRADHYTHAVYAAAITTLFDCSRWIANGRAWLADWQRAFVQDRLTELAARAAAPFAPQSSPQKGSAT